MLKYKLYFAVIFLMILPPNKLTNDFYSKFHQKDYKIDFQRIELVHYNKSFYNFVEVKTFKYNRSLPVTNITFNSKLNMSTEIEVTVQFYKLLSNEYRLLSGSNFQVNYCKSINTNILGLQILFKCGNFTSCQIVKETTYKLCNIYPDQARFPPFLPTGEYKFEIDFLYIDEITGRIAMYLKIHRPIARPRI